MLSTVATACSWARIATGVPNARNTAATNDGSRCIRTGWRVGAPARMDRRWAGLGLRPSQRPEREPLAIGRDIHFDLVAAAEIPHEDLLAQRILDIALDRALERARPVTLVVPVL